MSQIRNVLIKRTRYCLQNVVLYRFCSILTLTTIHYYTFSNDSNSFEMCFWILLRLPNIYNMFRHLTIIKQTYLYEILMSYLTLIWKNWPYTTFLKRVVSHSFNVVDLHTRMCKIKRRKWDVSSHSIKKLEFQRFLLQMRMIFIKSFKPNIVSKRFIMCAQSPLFVLWPYIFWRIKRH